MVSADYFKIFIPLFIAFVSERLAVHVNLIMVSRLGETAAAAFGGPSRVMLLDAAAIFALAPIFSVLIASTRSNQAKRSMITASLAISFLIGVALTVCGLFLYPHLAHFGVADPKILALVQKGIFWQTLSIPFLIAQAVGAMALITIGKGRALVPLCIAQVVLRAPVNSLFMYHMDLGFEGAYVGSFHCAVISLVWTLVLLRPHLDPSFSRSSFRVVRAHLVSQSIPEFFRLCLSRAIDFAVLFLIASGMSATARMGVYSVGLAIFLQNRCQKVIACNFAKI